ncbi:MAG: synthase [Segetibacter sp.]|nr:synthase [Segetibacter sp.]
MSWNEKKKIRIGILDLNEGHANQGMRCIREIINQWADYNHLDVSFDEFEVRVALQVPDLTYDAYISSGGPGSPLDSVGSEWEEKYFNWLQQVEDYNNDEANELKKHIFFICHSFQLACRHYNIAEVCKRKSTSFGVFPIHRMADGKEEAVFSSLNDPFYAVDSRDFQVINPNHNSIAELGGKILAIEKERPHVPYERAIMSVRFNEYFIGTQFHPEADPTGMSMYLQREDKKQTVIDNHGQEKWESMINQLNDPGKILMTHDTVLPNFLNIAVGELVES